MEKYSIKTEIIFQRKIGLTGLTGLIKVKRIKFITQKISQQNDFASPSSLVATQIARWTFRKRRRIKPISTVWPQTMVRRGLVRRDPFRAKPLPRSLCHKEAESLSHICTCSFTLSRQLLSGTVSSSSSEKSSIFSCSIFSSEIS